MGQALARALLTAGHEPIVWNRTAARSEALAREGARPASDAAGAVAAASLVIACLRDDGVVGEVVGPLTESLRGRTLLNATSTAPSESRRRAEWAAANGIEHLDAAILTPTPTIGGPSAVILYAGAAPVYDKWRPVLDAFGGRSVHLGDEPGRAAAYDASLLSLFWFSVLGITHALAIADAEGVPGADLVPYVQAIAAMVPEMTGRFAGQLTAGEYPGERSTVASAASGVQHLAATVGEHELDGTLLAAATTFLRSAVDAGHGADGLARLADHLRRPAN